MFLSSCSTVKKGFSSQKKDNSDEFLVEKKSPLVMPPDYNDLPIPKDENVDKKDTENEIKLLISKNKKNEIKASESKKNKTFEDSLLKKIKEN
jgi:hypothetical protein